MPATVRVRIYVRSDGPLFRVHLDEQVVQFGADGEAVVQADEGQHVLTVRATGTPGTRFEVGITSPGEAAWEESAVFPASGKIAMMHQFTTGGTDWTGPQA